MPEPISNVATAVITGKYVTFYKIVSVGLIILSSMSIIYGMTSLLFHARTTGVFLAIMLGILYAVLGTVMMVWSSSHKKVIWVEGIGPKIGNINLGKLKRVLSVDQKSPTTLVIRLRGEEITICGQEVLVSKIASWIPVQ